MDTEPTSGEKIAREAQAFAQSIVDTVRAPLLVLDADLRVVSANRAFRHTFHVSAEQTQGTLVYELGNRQWDIPELRRLLEQILPQHTHLDNFEVRHAFPAIGHKVRRGRFLAPVSANQPWRHCPEALPGLPTQSRAGRSHYPRDRPALRLARRLLCARLLQRERP